jgi:DNA-binding MurR/RpiR family transcriptional regulator
VAAPTGYKELEELLRERFDAFTPQQQRLAQRLLSDPEGCAFQTVSQLAESADVDPSTVVRFAATLGLTGYPDLARLCQQRLREQAQLLERFGTLTYLEDVGDGLLPRTATYDQANITRTFANVDPDDWARATKALAHARMVRIVGLRKSFAPASLLTTLLGLIRDDVRHLNAVHTGLPDDLRRLRSDDAVVALSIHRYTHATVQSLAFARRRGATTIAFTDNAASPLVPHADVVFYVEVAGATILRSVTAIISLVQALASAVATELGADTRESLLVEEELLAEFGVYLAPDDDRLQRPTGDAVRQRASRAAHPTDRTNATSREPR